MRKFLLVLLVLLAPACDPRMTPGGDRALLTVDPSAPCSLLSPEQVARALDMTVDQAAEVDSHPDNQGRTVPLCLYETGHPYDSVTIQLEGGVSASDFESRLNRDPINTARIEGLGDDAFIHAGTSVSVSVGQEVVTIALKKFGRHEATKIVLERLAREALSELRG
jgi:hypothetical protein